MKLKPIHPGEILREEFMIPLNIDNIYLAEKLGIEEHELEAIVYGEGSLNEEACRKLAEYFKTSEDFWINLQRNYDEIQR